MSTCKSRGVLNASLLVWVSTILSACSYPLDEKLTEKNAALMFETRFMSLPEKDRLSINRYYSRRESFPSITPIAVGAPLRTALEEQRRYESINLEATVGGGQRMNLEGVYGAYYSLSLYSSEGANKYPITGLSGTVDLIDEFGNVLLTKEVTVRSKKDEHTLPLVWLPLSDEQEKAFSKIHYEKISVCFKSGLKIKDDRETVSTVDFPLCYKRNTTWKDRF